MFAQAQILGNIGRLDIRSTGQNKVANFSLACNEKRNGTETTHWFTVAAWDRLADVLEQYAGKGAKVLVHGRLSTRTYVDKENVTRVVTEITATAIELVDTKNAQNGTATGSAPAPATNTSSTPAPSAHRPGKDDDLPF